MSRRIGNWQYERYIGWRLDGTDLVLDYDPLDVSGDLRGCYLLATLPRGSEYNGGDGEPIDHYLVDAMRYVEDHRVGQR